MRRKFKRRLKNPVRKSPPTKSHPKPAAPPALQMSGPGSLKEILGYLCNRIIRCGCATRNCDHRFSLHQGWEILCNLSWRSDEKLAELPESVQSMIREYRRRERVLATVEARVQKYLPKKGRESSLMMQLSDAVLDQWSMAIAFCTTWGYGRGSLDGQAVLKEKIWDFSKQVDGLAFYSGQPHFEKAYLAPIPIPSIGGKKLGENLED